VKTNRDLAIQLFKRCLPEFVSDACQLEGINFTVPEVQTLMGGVTVGNKDVHEQNIALNQIAAWKAVLADLKDDRTEVSKAYSHRLHAIAAKEDAMTWGEFRTGMVTIAGTDYLPPDANNLDHLFDEMLSDFAHIEDHYDKAIFLFLSFAKNQFYYDNNKRQGRFMMNTYLLDAGLPAISIPKHREDEFNHAMLRFYNDEHNDPTEMRSFLMSCIPPVIASQFEIPIEDYQIRASSMSNSKSYSIKEIRDHYLELVEQWIHSHPYGRALNSSPEDVHHDYIDVRAAYDLSEFSKVDDPSFFNIIYDVSNHTIKIEILISQEDKACHKEHGSFGDGAINALSTTTDFAKTLLREAHRCDMPLFLSNNSISLTLDDEWMIGSEIVDEYRQELKEYVRCLKAPVASADPLADTAKTDTAMKPA